VSLRAAQGRPSGARAYPLLSREAQVTKIPDKTRDKKEQRLMIKPPTREDPRVGGLSPWTPIGGQAAGIGDPAIRKSRDPTIRRRQ